MGRCAVVLVVGGWLALAGSAAGQCAGDCNGDGAVAIGDLILAVRIVLGDAPLDQCLAADVNDNGAVAINELIIAVRNGLRGCPPTPIPTSTPTVTATFSPSATSTSTPSASPSLTASATPTATSTSIPTPTIDYPDVSGVWREGQLRLVSSTCLEIFATEFAAELAQRPPCPHQVSSLDARATVVDCSSRAFIGTLDEQGLVTYSLPQESDVEQECSVVVTTTVRVMAAMSPATASYFFDIRFSGDCPLASCTLTAAAVWELDSGSG